MDWLCPLVPLVRVKSSACPLRSPRVVAILLTVGLLHVHAQTPDPLTQWVAYNGADLAIVATAKDVKTGSARFTEPGSTIEYKTAFNNNGDLADNVVVSETIPEGTRFVEGSLNGLPASAVVTYSPDPWHVKTFTVAFAQPLPGPVDYWLQNSADAFNSDARDRVVVVREGDSVAVRLAPQGYSRAEAGDFDDTSRQSIRLAPFDADGDGDLDIAVVNAGSGESNELYLNNGNGGFVRADAGDFDKQNRATLSLAVLDADGDGDLDLAANHIYSGSPFNQLYLNDGAGHFTKADAGDFSARYEEFRNVLLALDANGDGKTDLVTTGDYGNYLASCYLGDGVGSFTYVYPQMGGAWRKDHDGALLDYNRDGFTDILVAADSHVMMWASGHNGTFYQCHATVIPPENSGISSVAVLPNGNGFDYVIGRSGNQQNLYYRYDAAENTQHRLVDSGDFDDRARATSDILAFDADGDGDLDLAVANISQGNEIFINDGNNQFTRYPDCPFTTDGESSQGLASFDVDGDGDQDLLVANSSGPKRLYLNENLHESGHILSTEINVRDYPIGPDGVRWGKLVVDQTVPGGTDLSYDILDASTGLPVGGSWENLHPDSMGQVDLGALPASLTAIKVRANFRQLDDGADCDMLDVTPSLRSWMVTAVVDRQPGFTFQVTVDNPVPAPVLPNIVRTCQIASSTPDSVPENNTATVLMAVQKTDLQVGLRVDKADASSGDAILYTLTYGANGPEPATHTVLRQQLPPGAQYQAGAAVPVETRVTGDGSEVSPFILEWDLGTLAVGASGIVTVPATLDAGAGGRVLCGLATIANDIRETIETNNFASVLTTVAFREADVAVGLTVRDVRTGDSGHTEPGSTLEYTATYAGLGGAAQGVTVALGIPDGTCYESNSLSGVPSGAGVAFSPSPGNPRTIAVSLNASLPAARGWWKQQSAADWNNAQRQNVVMVPSGNSVSLRLDFQGFVKTACGALENVSRYSRKIVPIDADGDGDLDLIVGNGWNNQPNELFLNDGNGVFSKGDAGDFDKQNRNTMSLAVLDANRDGVPDIAVCYYGGASPFNQLFLNDGAGHFSKVASGGFGSRYEEVRHVLVALDVNGDKKMDLATTGDYGNYPASCYIGAGNGSFTYMSPNMGGEWRTDHDAFLLDYDHDGYTDILLAANDYLMMWRSEHNGKFRQYHWTCIPPAGSVINAVAAIPDGYGHYDYALGRGNGPNVYYRYDPAQGTQHTIVDAGAFDDLNRVTTDIVVLDADGDGDTDLAVANNGQPNELFLNDGSRRFARFTTGNFDDYSFPSIALAAFDADADGDADLAVANYGQPNELYMNEGLYESGSVVSPAIVPANLMPGVNLVQWQELIVDQSLPVGTLITYDILDANGQSVGSAWAGLNADLCGRIDLRALPVTLQTIKVRANLLQIDAGEATDLNEQSPILRRWFVTFAPQSERSIVFRVTVDDPFPVGLSEIDNAVTISTLSPESVLGNNTAHAVITAADTTPPVITAPSDLTLIASGDTCGASDLSLGEPVASDDSGVVTVSNDAPSVFSIGLTLVTWTATDPSGNTATAVQRVLVNAPLEARIAAPQAVEEGALIAFSSANTVGCGPLTFLWHFGDSQTDTRPDVSHAYADNGVYEVTLVVDDTHGNSSMAVHSITVANVAPVVPMTPNKIIDEDAELSLALCVTDPGCADSLAVTVNWGDGVVQSATLSQEEHEAPMSSVLASASHHWDLPGVYTVTVTARDDDGGVTLDTFTVTVQDAVPPVANLFAPGADWGPSALVQGVVPVVGQAHDVHPDHSLAPTPDNFGGFSLSYAPGAFASQGTAMLIPSCPTPMLEPGVMTSWDTSSLGAGWYTLLLNVTEKETANLTTKPNIAAAAVNVFVGAPAPVLIFGEDRLHHPAAVAVAESVDGVRIYVADQNNRIWVYELRNDVVTFQGEVLLAPPSVAPGKGKGNATGQSNQPVLQHPEALALQGPDYLLVADTLNNRVLKISLAGPLSQPKDWTTIGIGANFRQPCGIAVADDGSVYVTDAPDSAKTRLTKLNADGTVNDAATANFRQLQFIKPQHLSLAPDGTICVADANRPAVVMVQDPPNGVQELVGQSLLGKPMDVVVDAFGTMVVADLAQNALVVLSPDGRETARFGTPGIMPTDLELFGLDTCLLVVDRNNFRLILYRLAPDSAVPGGGSVR